MEERNKQYPLFMSTLSHTLFEIKTHMLPHTRDLSFKQTDKTSRVYASSLLTRCATAYAWGARALQLAMINLICKEDPTNPIALFDFV